RACARRRRRCPSARAPPAGPRTPPACADAGRARSVPPRRRRKRPRSGGFRGEGSSRPDFAEPRNAGRHQARAGRFVLVRIPRVHLKNSTRNAPWPASAQRPLQGFLDDGFGTHAVLVDGVGQALHLSRLVTQRGQCGARLGQCADRRGRSAGQRDLPHPGLVAHLQHQALGGLLADAGDLHQAAALAGADHAPVILDADAGQHRQRHLGADAGNPDQIAEQALLRQGGEAEQQLRVLAHHQVGVQHHGLAHRRQAEEGRHRRFDLVADAMYVEQQQRRLLVQQGAAETADHDFTPPRVTAATWARVQRPLLPLPAAARSAAVPRSWAWHSATASASAASAGGASRSLSSALIMCCTWAFSARPWPTTADLTWAGAYSARLRPAPASAQIAAPRAWPSTMALETLRLTNTDSTAASCGAYSRIRAPSSLRICSSRSVRAPSPQRIWPCASQRWRGPSISITP